MKYRVRREYISFFFILVSILITDTIYAQAIKLTWNHNPELDINYYDIFKSVASNPQNRIARVYAPDTVYRDDDVIIGQGYYYRITANDSADNISEFSEEIYIVANESTPVELNSFFANFVNDVILLQWNTASESNNFGFEIQKSKDGSNFGKIGFIQGRGTAVNCYTYNFSDLDICCGTYYYRLKQIDMDGNFNYSNMITVQINIPEKFRLRQNYPNPFNPETTIKYTIADGGRVRLDMFDMLGRTVRNLVDENKKAGYYAVKWDGRDNYGNDVGTGVYLCRMRIKGICQTKKIVLRR